MIFCLQPLDTFSLITQNSQHSTAQHSTAQHSTAITLPETIFRAARILKIAVSNTAMTLSRILFSQQGHKPIL